MAILVLIGFGYFIINGCWWHNEQTTKGEREGKARFRWFIWCEEGERKGVRDKQGLSGLYSAERDGGLCGSCVCVCEREREWERKEKGWRVEGRRGQEVVYIAWRERKREIERVCMWERSIYSLNYFGTGFLQFMSFYNIWMS